MTLQLFLGSGWYEFWRPLLRFGPKETFGSIPRACLGSPKFAKPKKKCESPPPASPTKVRSISQSTGVLCYHKFLQAHFVQAHRRDSGICAPTNLALKKTHRFVQHKILVPEFVGAQILDVAPFRLTDGRSSTFVRNREGFKLARHRFLILFFDPQWCLCSRRRGKWFLLPRIASQPMSVLCRLLAPSQQLCHTLSYSLGLYRRDK